MRLCGSGLTDVDGLPMLLDAYLQAVVHLRSTIDAVPHEVKGKVLVRFLELQDEARRIVDAQGLRVIERPTRQQGLIQKLLHLTRRFETSGMMKDLQSPEHPSNGNSKAYLELLS